MGQESHQSHEPEQASGPVAPKPAPVLDPESPIRRPAWVAHVLDDDRAVLLHLPSAQRKVLSPEATAIWQAIVAGGSAGVSAQAIADDLATSYTQGAEAISSDVLSFVRTLHEADLVEIVSTDGQEIDGP